MSARRKSAAPPTSSPAKAIEHFLRTGDHDVMCDAWPGSVLERSRRGGAALAKALVQEVHRLAPSPQAPDAMTGLDVQALTRSKVEPMVRGLFPRKEQDAVLALLKDSVVFLTPETIDGVLMRQGWLSTAWDLANLYLASVGAELLGEDAPHILGLSAETTCYVSMDYFSEEDPFADFIAHEVAHVFHNCKRILARLPEVRGREWLLDIEFSKRETFAYSCEAYSRIIARAKSAAERRALADQFAGFGNAGGERVDQDEVADAVRAACLARNGWATIRNRCAPSPSLRPL